MSFIEVQVALMLLLVGVIALIELPSLMLEGNRLSEQHVVAAQSAQLLLEQELAHTYDYEQQQPSSSGWSTLTSSICPGVTSNLYTFQILRADHPKLGQMARVITVQVRWMDPNKKRYGTYQIFSLSGYKPRSTTQL